MTDAFLEDWEKRDRHDKELSWSKFTGIELAGSVLKFAKRDPLRKIAAVSKNLEFQSFAMQEIAKLSPEDLTRAMKSMAEYPQLFDLGKPAKVKQAAKTMYKEFTNVIQIAGAEEQIKEKHTAKEKKKIDNAKKNKRRKDEKLQETMSELDDLYHPTQGSKIGVCKIIGNDRHEQNPEWKAAAAQGALNDSNQESVVRVMSGLFAALNKKTEKDIAEYDLLEFPTTFWPLIRPLFVKGHWTKKGKHQAINRMLWII